MTVLHVVAFDPGETTGWAALGVEPDVLLGAKDANDRLNERLSTFKTGQIICNFSDPSTPEFSLSHSSLNIYGENRGVTEMLNKVHSYSSGDHQPAVVIEDFILDPNKAVSTRNMLSPVRITSSFSFGYDAYQYNPSRIFIQNRSPVKTTCTDDRLKNWKLYDRNSGPHARDAVRHAFYFLRNCRGNSIKARTLRWRAWPEYFSDPLIEEIKAAKPQKKPGRRVNL